MSASTTAAPAAVHVVPATDGAWLVIPEGAGPASRHVEATGAERAARGLASAFDMRMVVVHDRYGRVRTTPTPAL